MNQQTDLSTMLSLISQPAFCVCGGSIVLCNKAAEGILIHSGSPISELLRVNAAEYEQFQGGCLLLPLDLNGLSLQACVTRMDDKDIFVIQTPQAQSELNAYSLASTTLRQPVSSVITLVRSLSPVLQKTGDPKVKECDARLKHHLWRIHRMLCNMSDAKYYADGHSNRMVCQNITSVVDEIFQKAQQVLAQCGVKLHYQLPDKDILCLIDEQLLERGIYNMISNAVKFSDSEIKEIDATLACRNHRLYLSIENRGIQANIAGDMFQRYCREPGIEDGRNGIGLGMALIRSAATVHGGTVLLDHPKGTGTRVTVSFPVKLGKDVMVASGIQNMDYAGGWDHVLLELSDILPSDFYAST